MRTSGARALGAGLLAGALATAPTPLPAQVNDMASAWGTQGQGCAAPAESEARPWLNPRYAPECRARYALAQFRTVEEKLLYIAPPRRVPPPPPTGTTPGASSVALLFGEAITPTCAYSPKVSASYRAPPGPSSAPIASPPSPPPPAIRAASEAAAAKVRDVGALLALPTPGKASDGPAGVRGANCVTAFNSPLSVAATFDPAMATRYGDLMGADFHDAGYNFQFGPAMDMARTWRFGRVTESFGEDPFLAATMVRAEIGAIAAHHVVSQMKHFAAYTQEAGRVGDQPSGQRPAGNEQVSERALREIYLPAFKGAVEGGAGQVMCAFPRVNGAYACDNTHLLSILKREWGFDGAVGADYPSAQRTIVPAFLAGLDTGTTEPDAGTFAGQMGLREAVAQGLVPEARLDDLILRRLIPQFRLGVFEHVATRNAPDVSTPERRAQVADLIAAGSVLLKNRNDILPFRSAVKSIAIIGAQATEKAQVTEQGSAIVNVQHLEPVLDAVRARAGGAVRVAFAQGTWGLDPLPRVPQAALRTPAGRPGVRATYAANPNLDFATPLVTRDETTLGLAGAPSGLGLPADQSWSVRYETRFTPALTGLQKFTVHVGGTVRLFVDGRLVGATERADFGDAAYAVVPGRAGKPIDLRIEYSPRAALRPGPLELFGAIGGTQVRVGYAPPDTLIADAARAAARADVAVVFVGHKVGEGMDRTSLSLPNDQDALIEAVARANPRTVVVLNTGGAVAMPWLDRVAAVLEMWLPGDAYGPAAAKLLFGDAEPGGRLPVTFPRDETQGPATKPYQYPGLLDAQGRIDTAWLDEGVFIGYRFWDQHAQDPLFPFGYGLGYTRFTVAGNALRADADGGATVSATVTNIGKRAGSEIVQVYVGLGAETGSPPQQLRGLAKVMLQPGEARLVEIKLPTDAFLYWSERQAGWTRGATAPEVMIGTSSRDIVWRGKLAQAPATTGGSGPRSR